MPYTGDKFCCDCFDKRKSSASNYHYENISYCINSQFTLKF